MSIPDNKGKLASSGNSHEGPQRAHRLRNAILTGLCIGFFYALFRSFLDFSLPSGPIVWWLFLGGFVLLLLVIATLRRWPK